MLVHLIRCSPGIELLGRRMLANRAARRSMRAAESTRSSRLPADLFRMGKRHGKGTLTHPLRTVPNMRTHEMFLDPRHPRLVHASAVCEYNIGLLFEVESLRGPVELIDELIAGAHELGLVAAPWDVRHHEPCSECCLVMTHEWAIAA